MDDKIIVAIIGFLGVLVTAVFGYLAQRSQKKRARAAEQELNEEAQALDFEKFFLEWSEIQNELIKLFEETPVDRFLLLRAFNGEFTPRWTTAIFQFRQGNQKPVNYMHVELDADYVERLRQIIIKSPLCFDIAAIPQCLIRNIYEAEGVKKAAWFHLFSRRMINSKSRSITYVSFASHKDVELDRNTITRCQLLCDRITYIATRMDESDNRTAPIEPVHTAQ